MVEVQDIDALLIGALYGELTPADEARLAAHLESHPTDKTALDQLTHARGLIKPYIGELVDPPQAISALLLQEAVRRAPRKVVARSSDESWFTRFVRSFASHPAMAAAAMLVIVIGVAGTMYMRKGSDQFAEEKAAAIEQPATTLDRSRTLDEGAKDNAAPAAAPAIGGALAEGSGSAYGADLAGKEKEALKLETATDAKKVAVAQASNDRAKAIRHQGIQVRDGDALMPRELAAEAPMNDKKPEPRAEQQQKAQKADEADDDQTITRSGAMQGAGAPGGPPAQTAPPPSPAPAKTVMHDSNTNAVTGADVSWTKTEHARAIAFVKAGKCDEAAKVAIAIADRDPDYFAANVATDRALKPCMPAITQLRDVESEKTQKARAQKRVNANEPAPADNVK